MRTIATIVLILVLYSPVLGAEGAAESDPLFRDSVMEYLQPGTIIMVGDSSVERLPPEF